MTLIPDMVSALCRSDIWADVLDRAKVISFDEYKAISGEEWSLVCIGKMAISKWDGEELVGIDCTMGGIWGPDRKWCYRISGGS